MLSGRDCVHPEQHPQPVARHHDVPVRRWGRGAREQRIHGNQGLPSMDFYCKRKLESFLETLVN